MERLYSFWNGSQGPISHKASEPIIQTHHMMIHVDLTYTMIITNVQMSPLLNNHDICKFMTWLDH